MPHFLTTQFGPVDYEEPAVVHFPLGLPAFEQETRFLIIEEDTSAPLVFLQSLRTPDLVFLTLPVKMLDTGYRLRLAVEDLAALGLDTQPADGDWRDQVLALAILTVKPGRPVTANLLAPVVIHATSRRAVQAIQSESAYSVEEPLGGPPPDPQPPREGACS